MCKTLCFCASNLPNKLQNPCRKSHIANQQSYLLNSKGRWITTWIYTPVERQWSWCSSRMILVNSKICSTYVCTKGVCIHFSPLSLSHLVTEISVKLWIWLGSLKFWTPCPAERQRLYRRNANLISHWPGHASQLSTSIQSNSSILVKTVTRYSLLKHSAFSFLHA